MVHHRAPILFKRFSAETCSTQACRSESCLCERRLNETRIAIVFGESIESVEVLIVIQPNDTLSCMKQRTGLGEILRGREVIANGSPVKPYRHLLSIESHCARVRTFPRPGSLVIAAWLRAVD
ncbi:MAG: hypothetical protein ACXWAW_18350, partial [Usitatibacter sp.]